MEAFLHILVKIIFFLVIISLFATTICIINFSTLLQKTRKDEDQRFLSNPFSRLVRTSGDERLTFWRNGLIIWGLIFFGLIAACFLIVWLAGGAS
jgi:hypothetical protein